MNYSKAVKLGGKEDLVQELAHDLTHSVSDLRGCQDVLRSVHTLLSKAPAKYESVLLEANNISVVYALSTLDQSMNSIGETIAHIADAQQSDVNRVQAVQEENRVQAVQEDVQENAQEENRVQAVPMVVNDNAHQRLARLGLGSNIKANKKNFVILEQATDKGHVTIATPSHTFPLKWKKMFD